MSTTTNDPPSTLCVLDSDRSLTPQYHSLSDRLGMELKLYHHSVQIQHDLQADSAACLVASIRPGDHQTVDSLQKIFGKHLNLLNVLGVDQTLASTACDLVSPGTVSLMMLPIDFANLESWVAFCLHRYLATLELRRKREDFDHRISLLSDRQRKILDLISTSVPNKSIAANLSVSQRTIETDRAVVLRTFEADTAIDVAIRIGESRVLNEMLDSQSIETSPWAGPVPIQA